MKILKKILKITLYSVLTIIGIVALYLLCERVLSRWTVAEQPQTEPKNIKVFVMSNGVHTDIVMPTKTEYKDWSQDFPYANTKGKQTDYPYVSVGWGDRGFFLDTPTWADLKASTAFVAATGLGKTALHVTYHKSIKLDELTKEAYISEAQYKKMIAYIEASTEKNQENKPILIVTNAQYGNDDAFYEAKGSYSLFGTCNSWLNRGLKGSGMKASHWVAFDKGILYQYSK